MSKIELGKIVYHKDIYWGREPMKIVGIRADEVELEGDYSGGTHAVCQKDWMPIEGLLFERADTKEKKMRIDVESINGSEILKFLEEQIDDNEDLCDVSVDTPLEFVSQEVKNGKYTLKFNAYYNNWGTDQLIEDNKLYIENGKVDFRLQEPFESDGSESALEEVLEHWLKTHKFQSKDELSVKWHGMVHFCCESLEQLTFDDTKRMEHIIEELTEARSLMK